MKLLMNGAFGKMGRAISAGLVAEDDLELVAAVDVKAIGQDYGFICGTEAWGIQIEDDLQQAIARTHPDVIIDFTNPQAVLKNISIALAAQTPIVVGTTGFSQADYDKVNQQALAAATPVFVAANFALGAVLMMKYAADAAKYFPQVEIIERHHDQKLDAPSGTAATTLQKISEVREAMGQGNPQEFEKINGSRGGDFQGMKVHSVRLPGYVASQEVIFGGLGQRLVITHDTINRDCYIPGVALACRRIPQLQGLVCGLDSLL